VDAGYLMNLVRCTGAVVALVASSLAAPEVTRHFLVRQRMRIVTAGRTVKVQAKRAWLKIRGRGPMPRSVTLGPGTIGTAASATASLTVTWDVNADAPLMERVERLEQRVATLKKMHSENERAIEKEAADRREMVERVSSKIVQEAAAIRSEIAAVEQNALLVDARALPVIGFGIVLTSIPDLIARSTTLSGLAIAVALIFLERAWVHFWATGPAGEAKHLASG
jgi:hypothetical protein